MDIKQYIGQSETRAALWWRWTLATGLGELIGFAVPAIVGALAALLALSDGVRFVPLVLAGMGEGALLAFAQWLALRSALQRLDGRAWVLATALAAGLAWTIGLIPSTFVQLQRIDAWLQIATFAVLGVVFLVSIGGAQWLILRHHVRRAAWWIPANALAWPLGVAVPVIGLSVLPDTASFTVLLLVGVGCGLLMGLVVGALTGVVLIALLHDRPMRVRLSAGSQRP